MFKNVASKFIVFAWDTTTGLAKTGDAANITAYVSKDYGAVTVLGDTSATEMDSTNAKGYYLFDAAQAETNGDCLMISAKSSTANIAVVGAPAVIYTRPTTGWLAPTTAGRTLDVSAGGEAGIDWANIGSPTTAVNLSGTNIDADQVVASVSGAVGSIGAGGITAASFAANSITAAKLDPDVTTELQSGLATAADLATIAGYLDTEIASILAAVDTEVAAILADTNELQTDWANGGRLDVILDARASQTSVDDLPTNAELATALGTADDAVLSAIGALNNLSSAQAQTAAAAALTAYDPPTKTELDSAIAPLALEASLATVDGKATAIKAKTDSLTFTQAGQVDANIQYVNDVELVGDGSATPFNVA